MTLSAVTLAQELIRCPSVTPADAGAQDILSKTLKGLGFECYHLPFGDISNLFARIGSSGPHLCYAGHTDVVPPGPAEEWTYGPFNPEIAGGRLYGRGVADMKGSVAAFAAGAASYLKKHGTPQSGSISLLITGDEEAAAVDGTAKVLEWMEQHGHIPDAALVGEPTNPEFLGQEIKIGRRGSLTGALRVKGKQGHVAYQMRADNPLPRLVKMLDALASHRFDEGSPFFPPTNLEITTVDVCNTADNIIPGCGYAQFNVRFNDNWTGETLGNKIREILDGVTKNYALTFRYGAESFLTEPGPWPDLVTKAVQEKTGLKPKLTTTGGTSDARFIRKYCPVVEFGPVNATIHQIDENTEVSVLEALSEIYSRILELYFKS